MRDKLREAFDLLGNDIALAHAKDLDHDGEAYHLAAGEGLLDYPLYLSSCSAAASTAPSSCTRCTISARQRSTRDSPT
jgi:sugar phosphate isomerase/epimerase